MAGIDNLRLDAKRIAEALDVKNNSEQDGKIEKSIWDDFIDNIREETGIENLGNHINKFILVDNAIAAIKRYASTAAAQLQEGAESVLNKWMLTNNNLPQNEEAPAALEESGTGYNRYDDYGNKIGEVPKEIENKKLDKKYLRPVDLSNTDCEENGDGTRTVTNQDGTKTVYNENGFVIKELDAKGRPTRIINYGKNTINSYTDIDYNNCCAIKYDYWGKPIEYKDVDYNPDNEKNGDYYTVRYSANEPLDIVREEYDNGVLKRRYEYNDDGSVNHSLEYVYDDEGNLSRIVRRGADGKVEYYDEIENDEDGNEIKRTSFSPRGIKLPNMEEI